MNRYPTLDALESADPARTVRDLKPEELDVLADEIRRRLIEHCSMRSAHFASNLGVVELTIALHHVFDPVRDAIVFDVGHQVYPHKMLTGRFRNFQSVRSAGGLSGYPDPNESPADVFRSGHASTAISTALGLDRKSVV